MSLLSWIKNTPGLNFDIKCRKLSTLFRMPAAFVPSIYIDSSLFILAFLLPLLIFLGRSSGLDLDTVDFDTVDFDSVGPDFDNVGFDSVGPDFDTVGFDSVGPDFDTVGF